MSFTIHAQVHGMECNAKFELCDFHNQNVLGSELSPSKLGFLRTNTYYFAH